MTSLVAFIIAWSMPWPPVTLPYQIAEVDKAAAAKRYAALVRQRKTERRRKYHREFAVPRAQARKAVRVQRLAAYGSAWERARMRESATLNLMHAHSVRRQMGAR